jgi:hypothetical protein
MATINSIDMNSTIGSSGEIVIPVQPAFLAQATSDITLVTGDGTAYTCLFTEQFDRGSNFASNVFTAPVDGRYLFSANVTISNIGSSHTIGLLEIVTTSNSFPYHVNPYEGSSHGSGTKLTLVCHALCELSATDTVSVRLTVSGSTKTITFCGSSTAYSTFSGALIS